MAGGNLSPRQKMINLMYLVFVAMLAMNMSKEVLSAFGLMNERFEGANTSATETNGQMLQALDQKQLKQEENLELQLKLHTKYLLLQKKFYDFIGTLKGDITKDIALEENGKLPYEAMDKGDKLDELWFNGDNYTPKGKSVLDAIETFKSELKAALGNEKKYESILNEVLAKFDTKEIKDKSGANVKNF